MNYMSARGDGWANPPESKLDPEHGVKCPECEEWWNNGEDSETLCPNCKDEGLFQCSNDGCDEVNDYREKGAEQGLCIDCYQDQYE